MIRKIKIQASLFASLTVFAVGFNACILTDAITAPPGGVSAVEVQQRVNDAAAFGWWYGCYNYLLDINPSATADSCLQESNDTLNTFLLVQTATGNNLGLDRLYYRGETVDACEQKASEAAFLSTFLYFQSAEKTTTVGSVTVKGVDKDDIQPSGLFASTNAAAGCNEVLEPTGRVVELVKTGL